MVVAMRMRAVLTAALLAAGLLAAPADAALPTLAGTTVISGSTTGAMRVRLPRDVTLSLDATPQDPGQGKDARFSGRGRLIGVRLVSRLDHDETWLTRSAVCMERGCATRPHFFSGITRLSSGMFDVGPARLSAGTYTLYWIADGAPASVTLSFRGLKGKTTLRPPPLARAQQWSPRELNDTVEPTTSVGARTYGGETEAPLPADGLLLGVTWTRGWLTGAQTVCLIDLDGPARPPVAGVCPPTAPGWTWNHGTTCATCFLTDLLLPNGEELNGLHVYVNAPKGDYELAAYAQFAGRFGGTGMTMLLLPDL